MVKELNENLVDFILNLRTHGIMKELNLNAKIVYVDEQLSNRASIQINFEDMDIVNNLILINDGHKVVSFFSTLIKSIETEIAAESNPDLKKIIHPVTLLLLDSNM